MPSYKPYRVQLLIDDIPDKMKALYNLRVYIPKEVVTLPSVIYPLLKTSDFVAFDSQFSITAVYI